MRENEEKTDKAARSYAYNNGYRDDNRDRYEAFKAGVKWALQYGCFNFECMKRQPEARKEGEV